MERLIYEFQKNELESVKCQFTEYKGHELIDLRVYFKGSEAEHPTKKGICISVDFLPELKKAIDLAIAEVKKDRGVI